MFVKNVLMFCGLSSMLVISSGLIINCDFLYTNQGGDIGNVYACNARVIFVGDTRIVTEVSDENHLPGNNASDVHMLNYNQTFGFTPRNVSSFFPNLKILYANAIDSSELRREDVEGFKDLQSLRFANNRIKELENDLFYNNHFLTSIYLENNPISHVGHNVFDNLNRLDTLFMYNTSCINQFAIDRTVVERLVFTILVECPPTFRMTEDKIINGSALTNRVQTQIESELEVLYSKLKSIEDQHNELEQRVEDLEQSINSTSSSPHINY